MEKLSHAYIVSSPSENARMSKAYELAQEMLCSSPDKRPCGVCRDCRKVAARVHPDLAVISRLTDDKGNRKKEILVDQIRALSADAYVLPNEAAAKVYIIADADCMNEQAQNAALKLFEEPPEGVHFILCAANPDKLLITVRSRCTTVRCTGAEDAEDEKTAQLADEFAALLDKNDVPGVTAWCFEHEKLDAQQTADFLCALKKRLVGMLISTQDKQRVMDIIRLVDRCLEYRTVNTGIKHILGLLAVGSAAETRKTID